MFESISIHIMKIKCQKKKLSNALSVPMGGLGIDRAITLISSRVIVPRRKFFLGGAIKNLASVKTTHASVTSPCGAQSKLGWTSMCKGRRWFSSRLGIQSHILVSLGLYST